MPSRLLLVPTSFTASQWPRGGPSFSKRAALPLLVETSTSGSPSPSTSPTASPRATRRVVEPRFLRPVREMARDIDGPKERQAFSGQVADQQRLSAGVVIIGGVDPHSGALLPLLAVGNPRLHSHLRERAISMVVKEPIGLG